MAKLYESGLRIIHSLLPAIALIDYPYSFICTDSQVGKVKS